MASDIHFTSAPSSLATGLFHWIPLQGILLVLGAPLLTLFVLKARPRKAHRAKTARASTAVSSFAPAGGWHMKQADALTRVAIRPRPLLNRSEAALQEMIRDWLASRDLPPLRLHAQVSMGEIFRVTTSGAAGRAGHSAYNSKRVDFLLVGADMMPRAGIEYQGSGHFQKDAVLRDAIKREVFRKAGIPFLEIRAKSTRAQVYRVLDRGFGLSPTEPQETEVAPARPVSP